MTDTRSAYIQLVQRCQSIIASIRVRLREEGVTEAVWNDIHLVCEAVDPVLMAEARKLRSVSPLAMEEAYELIVDKLHRDILSVGYQTLETKFGSYLRSAPLYIQQQVMRKFVRNGALLEVESFDHVTDAEAMPLHDTVADPSASTPFDTLADREAIMEAMAKLAPEERIVVQLWLQGYKNNDIAVYFGFSAPSATRIRQRAFEHLKRLLAEPKE